MGAGRGQLRPRAGGHLLRRRRPAPRAGRHHHPPPHRRGRGHRALDGEGARARLGRRGAHRGHRRRRSRARCRRRCWPCCAASCARATPRRRSARLVTRRHLVELRDGGGRLLGEVCDDEVSVLEGERVAARFREVEVEVVPGAPPALIPLVVDRLRGGRRRRARPDAEAGAGPRPAGPGAARSARAAPSGKRPVGRARRAGRHRRGGAAAPGPRSRRAPRRRPGRRAPGPGEHPAAAQRPQDVRRRSSSRRGPTSLRAELKGLADALGAVRDVDVLGVRLDGPPATSTGSTPRTPCALVRRLGRQRATAQADLIELPRLRASTSTSSTGWSRRGGRPGSPRRPSAPPPRCCPSWWPCRGASSAATPSASAADPTDEELHARAHPGQAGPLRRRGGRPGAARRRPRTPRRSPTCRTCSATSTTPSWPRSGCAAPSPTGTSRQQAFVAGLLVAAEREQAAAERGRWRTAWEAASAKKLPAWLRS